MVQIQQHYTTRHRKADSRDLVEMDTALVTFEHLPHATSLIKGAMKPEVMHPDEFLQDEARDLMDRTLLRDRSRLLLENWSPYAFVASPSSILLEALAWSLSDSVDIQ